MRWRWFFITVVVLGLGFGGLAVGQSWGRSGHDTPVPTLVTSVAQYQRAGNALCTPLVTSLRHATKSRYRLLVIRTEVVEIANLPVPTTLRIGVNVLLGELAVYAQHYAGYVVRHQAIGNLRTLARVANAQFVSLGLTNCSV